MRIKVVLFWLIITGIGVQQVSSQNKTNDSLQVVLKTAQEDSNRVNILNDLSRHYEQTGDYDKALEFANDAFSLSQKIKYKRGEAASYVSFGWIYEDQGNFPEALKNYKASLEIAEQTADKKGIASSYLGIGNIYYEQGDYQDALKNYFASLKISEETGNKKIAAALHTNIGEIYSHVDNYPEALKSFTAALKINEEIGNKSGMAYCYLGLGIINNKKGNYPDALEDYTTCLKISEETGNKNMITASYTNIGDIYFRQGNYPAALKNYAASLEISEEVGNKSGIANCYISISSLYLRLQKNTLAKKYLNDALSLSKEIGSKERLKEAYNVLTQLDSSTGDWEAAYQHHKMFILYRDSLVNEETTKKTVQMTMQYEFDKKDQETRLKQEKKDALAAEELKRQMIFRNSFIGGFIIVLFFSVVVLLQKKRIGKEKQRSDELLLNILPSETAEELKQTGTAKARRYETVTVIFTDFKNFTEISEKMTPEELVGEINYCYSEFDKILSKYNIEKIKTIGDSYMCAGGLPVENKRHAVDAIQAAMEMNRFMIKEKTLRQAGNKVFFEMRIGIHSGPVVAGIVGIKKFAYDIWGDAVNIASRIESSGKEGKINISETTYQLVKDTFTCAYRGEIDAKNKGMMKMYFVEG